MKVKYILSVLFFLIVAISCTKYGDPSPYSADSANDTSLALVTRKVLIVNIDGLGGETLQNATATNINTMLEHSKYNFSTYKGDTTTQPSVWQSLLTGIGYDTHLISDSSWLVPPGATFELTRTYYPSFFQLLQNTSPNIFSYGITPWPNLAKYGGFLYANKYQLTSNDKETCDSLTNNLSTGEYGVYLAEFNGYALEGKKSGFKASSTMDQISTIDSYIGKLMNAIHSRPDYSKEQWLVILNSQYGGDGITYLEDGFRIMNNDKFTKQEVKGFGYKSIIFSSNTLSKTGVLKDSSYNIGTGEYTLSFNFSCIYSSGYPSIISKSRALAVTGGWTLFTNSSGQIECRMYSSGTGALCRFLTNSRVADGTWHNITFVLGDTGVARNLRFYVDGVLDIGASGYSQPRPAPNFNLVNIYPLTLGSWSQDTTSGVATTSFNNIKIYKKALSASEVAMQAKQTDVSQDPNYGSLVGLWACNDGFRNQFKNSIPGKPSFQLGSALSWVQINPPPNGFANAVSSTDFSIDPINEDIVPNVFKWLRVPINAGWGLIQPWINDFEYEYGIQ